MRPQLVSLLQLLQMLLLLLPMSLPPLQETETRFKISTALLLLCERFLARIGRAECPKWSTPMMQRKSEVTAVTETRRSETKDMGHNKRASATTLPEKTLLSATRGPAVATITTVAIITTVTSAGLGR